MEKSSKEGRGTGQTNLRGFKSQAKRRKNKDSWKKERQKERRCMKKKGAKMYGKVNSKPIL